VSNKPLILQLDAAGNPQRWITFEIAAYYYAKDLVAWTPTEEGFQIQGGKSRMTGSRSFMDLSNIIAVRGEISGKGLYRVPTLTNRALFRRDQHICAYCGNEFGPADLTRDHVIARSNNGKDVWTNVVTSCGGCNRRKDDNDLKDIDMELLYVPYAPTRQEYLLLMNRNVLADQMLFLKAKIPANSHVHIPNFKEMIALRSKA
jgi:5-methylcytosine-specific restriction endonuclease McrA